MIEYKDGKAYDFGGDSDVFGPEDMLEDLYCPKQDDKEEVAYNKAMEGLLS